MKFKMLAVFSVVLIILGVASLGTMLQDLSEGIREDTYLGATMAVWFTGGGALLYWAARKRYAPGWRIYLGMFLVFFGFVGASVEADSIVNLRAEEPVFGFVLAGTFAIAGFLLARSGYRQEAWRAPGRSDGPAEAYTGWHGATPVSRTATERPEEAVAAAGHRRED